MDPLSKVAVSFPCSGFVSPSGPMGFGSLRHAFVPCPPSVRTDACRVLGQEGQGWLRQSLTRHRSQGSAAGFLHETTECGKMGRAVFFLCVAAPRRVPAEEQGRQCLGVTEQVPHSG